MSTHIAGQTFVGGPWKSPSSLWPHSSIHPFFGDLPKGKFIMELRHDCIAPSLADDRRTAYFTHPVNPGTITQDVTPVAAQQATKM